MKNLEIYEKDPRTHTLLNQGVAKVTSGHVTLDLTQAEIPVRTLRIDAEVRSGHLTIITRPGIAVSAAFSHKTFRGPYAPPSTFSVVSSASFPKGESSELGWAKLA